MAREAPSDWRQLQDAVAAVLREAGFDAEVEKIVQNARGATELDVYAEQAICKHITSLACECKHWKAAVPQAVVQTFRSVLADTGIDIGYIVSSAGFQSGAFAAAKYTNVRLVTWDQFLETFAPNGPPLAPGLRASAEITGGSIELHAPGGGTFPWMATPLISDGYVRRRDDGTLEAFVATKAAMPAMQEVNEQVGFQGIELRGTDQSLSSDPTQPTLLTGWIEFDSPDGMPGIQPVTGERTLYPAAHCRLDVLVFATLNGSRLAGRWEAQTLFNGVRLPFPLTGTFSLHLL